MLWIALMTQIKIRTYTVTDPDGSKYEYNHYLVYHGDNLLGSFDSYKQADEFAREYEDQQYLLEQDI